MHRAQHSYWRNLATLFVVGSAVTLLSCSARAAGPLWTDNMAQAMKQAATEKKDLLLDFTGSDWCGWCIKLHEEVFDLEAFKTAAPKKFVLVTLDFPQDKSKLSEATMKQNAEWQKKLSPAGFPTIFLTDEKGVPYAKTGYEPGGAEKYVAHLQELSQVRTKRDEALAKAAQTQGVDRAKALDSALAAVGDELALAHYGETAQEIVTLDADNKAGLKGKYEQKLNDAEVRKVVAQVQEDFSGENGEACLKKLAAAELKFKPSGEVRQELLALKLGIYGAAGKHEEALKLANEVLANKDLAADERLQFSLQKAGILTTLGRTDEAVKVFDALLAATNEKNEQRFLIHFYKAQTMVQAGKTAEAAAAFDAAIAAAPDAQAKKQLARAKATALAADPAKESEKPPK